VSGLPDWLMPHAVDVETYRGDTAYGDSYKPAATVRCAIDDQRRLVRGPKGDEVVSETTLPTGLEEGPRFTLDSRVTVNGRRTYVLGTSRHELGDMSEGDHLEVSLR
jgi:hypothetical protein